MFTRQGLVRLTGAVVLLSLAVTMARYTDPPDRFADAQVYAAATDLPRRHYACYVPPAPKTRSSNYCIDGAYLATSNGNVYLARSGGANRRFSREIIAEPVSAVKEVRLFENHATIRTSVIGWLLQQRGHSPLAVTPFGIWIGDRNLILGFFG